MIEPEIFPVCALDWHVIMDCTRVQLRNIKLTDLNHSGIMEQNSPAFVDCKPCV